MQLTRSPARRAGEYRWDPAQGYIDAGALDGVDAVVHLAGETVAGRWTDAKKRRIMDSRVQGTRLVSEAIAGLDRKPAVLVSASGIGVYGDSGDEPRTEESALGDGFLADVVRAWEGAADPARAAGIRVVHTRFGIVQSRRGGALQTQLPLFKLGLGGPVGGGRQYVSWVAIDDVVSAIAFALSEDDISGPVNVTAPGRRHAGGVRAHARPCAAPPGRAAGAGVRGARDPRRLRERGAGRAARDPATAARTAATFSATRSWSPRCGTCSAVTSRGPLGPHAQLTRDHREIRDERLHGRLPRLVVRCAQDGGGMHGRDHALGKRRSTNRPRSRVTRNWRPSSACAAVDPRHDEHARLQASRAPRRATGGRP